MITTLVLALMVGCGDKDGGDSGTGGIGTDGGSSDGGTSDGGATDGGSTTDGGGTDGGTTDGGSGDGGGDGGTIPVNDTLHFQLSGEWSGTTLTLTWVDSDSFAGGTGKKKDSAPVFGEVLTSVAVSSDELDVVVGEVPDEALIDFDDEGTIKAAFYVPALHVDGDGDGERSGEESFVGVGQYFAVWLEGEVVSPWTDFGLQAGWNSVRLEDTGGAEPDIQIGDPASVPLAANLFLREEVTISGSYSGIESADVRLGLMPGVLFDGGEADSWLFDETMPGSWSISLSGPPPDDHLEASVDGLFPILSIELPLGYRDLDGSGGWTPGDEATYMACNADGPVTLVWVPGLTDLWTGLIFSWYELQPGWFAMDVPDPGEDPDFLDVDSFTDLEIGDGCPFTSG